MKYIRTKDGIIEYNPNEIVSNNGVHIFISDDWNKSDYTYYEKDIVAQADTIEKLIDEFIEYNREKNKGFYIREYELEEVKNVIRKEPSVLERTDIFGAIWTDIGLIYVAKMNEKGELELL